MIDRIVTPDDRSRIARIIALPLRRKFRLVWRLRREPRVTRLMELPLAMVVAYLVLPVHLVPRWFPFFRRLDNLLAGMIGLWLFLKLIPADLLEEHLAHVERRH